VDAGGDRDLGAERVAAVDAVAERQHAVAGVERVGRDRAAVRRRGAEGPEPARLLERGRARRRAEVGTEDRVRRAGRGRAPAEREQEGAGQGGGMPSSSTSHEAAPASRRRLPTAHVALPVPVRAPRASGGLYAWRGARSSPGSHSPITLLVTGRGSV